MTKFDVIVPTYNRYADLPRFFEENAKLANRRDVVLWLEDDGSNSYSPDALPSWDNLVFIRNEENHGQAYVRNHAIAKGNSPYVISLDDDAWFEDADTALTLIEDGFERWPGTGCLMLNIATPNSTYSKEPTGTVLSLHVTCGCAYRRATLESIGGFSGFMHSGAEETDISLKIYREGWDIRFLAGARVFHNFLWVARSPAWLYNVRRNTTRNDLLIVLMYYPWFSIPFFIFAKFFSHLRFAAFRSPSPWKSFWYTASALFGFIGMSGMALQRRKPLTWKVLQHWKQLKPHAR
jgi:GT2 family glycosyltransferase